MSEFNHPFKTVKAPKSANSQEANALQIQSKQDFINHINNYFGNKEFCVDIEHKSSLSYECFLNARNAEHMDELANAIAQLSVSAKEDKDSCIKDVVGAGFLSSISQKGRNIATCAPLTTHHETKFCKHATRIMLGIGKQRHATLIKNYGSIVKSKHGNLGKNTQ